MIRYEDIVREISKLEGKKVKNEEKIKAFSDENVSITNRLKILNSKKEILEKVDSDLSEILPNGKKE